MSLVSIRDPNLNALFQKTLSNAIDMIDMLNFAQAKFEGYKATTQELLQNPAGSNGDQRRPFRPPSTNFRQNTADGEPRAPWKTFNGPGRKVIVFDY